MDLKIPARAALLLSIAALSGCSATSTAILQTLPYAYGRSPGIDSVRLNPKFRYLRLTIGGRVVLLAQGNEDADARGPVEVWYSAEREVLRLQHGRIVGAVGLSTEWREVTLPALPSWSELAHGEKAFRFTRTRDVMPGYRFGVKDALSLRVVDEPKRGELQGLDPRRLTWFEERFESAPGAGLAAMFGARGGGLGADTVLPPARYAVEFSDGRELVVYAEQCLAPKLCFTWQRWPVQAQNAAGQN